jgi:hypothetical protein
MEAHSSDTPPQAAHASAAPSNPTISPDMQAMAHQIYQAVMHEVQASIAASASHQPTAQQQPSPFDDPLRTHSSSAFPSSQHPASLPTHSIGKFEDSSTLHKLLNRPSTFHGEHGSRVHDWLSELEVIFSNCAGINESQKVAFAKQCLRAEALRWWMAREREVELASVRHSSSVSSQTHATDDSSAVVPVTSWQQFKEVLVEYFSPRGSSEAARSRVHSMFQSQFRSLAQYMDEFEKTARQITVPPGQDISDELVMAFKKGLSDGQIRLHLTTAHPTSLFQATKLALQAEDDLRVSKYSRVRPWTRRPFSSNYRTLQYPSWSSPSFVPHRDKVRHPTPGHPESSAPMELDMAAEDEDEQLELQEESQSPPEEVGDTSSPYSSEPEEEQGSNEPERSSALNSTTLKQHSPLTNQRRRPDKSTSRFDVRCYNCGRPDHLMARCPEPRRVARFPDTRRQPLQHPKKW